IYVLSTVPYYKGTTNNLLYCAQKCNLNKDYDGAISIYRKLISLQPANNSYYLPLALVYESKNQIDSVIIITNRLLAKEPLNASALGKLGEMYGKHLNNYDKSLDYLSKAYSISPKDLPLLENLGIVYGLKKNFEKSMEYFNKAIAVKPDNPQIYMNMAGTYFNMGNKQKADEYRAKAEKLLKAKK
ncbi:MAG: tetratricopeptide repeat protein, partial [Bacteroidetes bacterium]|nr:tetratricopeptide repeat protein [Bacteroidota bacterium]